METDETLASGDPPAAAAPAPGGRIGKYEIVRALGSGGMGVVWAARDPDLDREVAIKLLRSADASSEQRTRLLREARAMARLKHPNVLTVYEVDSDGPRDFIAMELVDGASLDVWLRERPPSREAWDALLAAGRGLAAAHAAGLVHRDFKPHNVLRSRDGRVLVTDFGLARGNTAVDDTLDPASHDPGDSVLDVQLTTTGQLLGTPAYMAPEQFTGGTPDPRTDQFAFCVTLWEALSGERPFRGTTIDELQRETAAGALRTDSKLPAAIRRVLVRGLSPARADRWPDMPALLHALERARATWPRRARIAVPAFGLVAAALVLATRTGPHAAVADACTPGEQVFASAWSPAMRAELLATHPRATEVADQLDRYRETWLAGYAKACVRAPAHRLAAVDCYDSRRDDVAVLVEALHRFPPEALREPEVWDALSSADPCAGDDPIAAPRIPDDSRRAAVIAFLAKLYGAAASAPQGLMADQATWRNEAHAIGWPPLEPRLEEMIAVSTQIAGSRELAVREYREAADHARAIRDYRVEARTRLALLELGRDTIIDEIPGHAYDNERRDAELAIRNSGNDPVLLAALDASRAAHAVYVDSDLSAGIAIADRVLATFDKAGDRHRGAQAAAALAEYLSLRAGPGDLERAAQIVEAHPAQAIDARIAATVRGAAYWIAWLRGDLDRTHAVLDASDGAIVANNPVIHGRVVDTAGNPVAGAHVVSWGGELFGDAGRAYTDPTFTYMQHARSDDHGDFTIVANDGDGLIAELGPGRSVPVASKPGVVLVIAPTHSISGQIDAGGDPAIGVEPFARIDVTAHTRWFVSTAPSADGRFTLAGIPAAAAVRLGAIGSHWPREVGRRILVGPAVDHAVIHWPTGPQIDVATLAPIGHVWALHGKFAPKTRGEVEQLVQEAPDAASVELSTLGWATTTYAGLEMFPASARHAVIADNAPGTTTICLAIRDRADVTCKTFDATPQAQPDVRDGRRWFGEIAAVFDATP